MCLKKAVQFGRLLSRRPTLPFVLLADWREAKPCWDILAEGVPDQLQLIVVYTEQDRQVKQAARWAETRSQHGCEVPVHVVPGHVAQAEVAAYLVRILQDGKLLACPTGPRIVRRPITQVREQHRVVGSSGIDFCAGMRRVSSFPGCQPELLPLASVAAVGPPLAIWTLQPAQSLWMCKAASMTACMQDQILDSEEPPQRASETMSEKCAGGPQKHMQLDHPQSPHFAAESASFVDQEAAKWAKPVADMLSSIFTSESLEDVERQLALCQPDYYED